MMSSARGAVWISGRPQLDDKQVQAGQPRNHGHGHAASSRVLVRDSGQCSQLVQAIRCAGDTQSLLPHLRPGSTNAGLALPRCSHSQSEGDVAGLRREWDDQELPLTAPGTTSPGERERPVEDQNSSPSTGSPPAAWAVLLSVRTGWVPGYSCAVWPAGIEPGCCSTRHVHHGPRCCRCRVGVDSLIHPQ